MNMPTTSTPADDFQQAGNTHTHITSACTITKLGTKAFWFRLLPYGAEQKYMHARYMSQASKPIQTQRLLQTLRSGTRYQTSYD